MEELVAPDKLRDASPFMGKEQIRAKTLPQQSAAILERLLYQGELPVMRCLDARFTPRQHAATSALTDHGVLTSETSARPTASPSPPPSPRNGCQGCSRRNEYSVTIHSILSSMQDSRSGMTRIY